MAFVKTITDPRGLTVSYHKIVASVANHVSGITEVYVSSYFNKDIRDENVENFLYQHKFELNINTDETSRDNLYLALQTMENSPFADAEMG